MIFQYNNFMSEAWTGEVPNQPKYIPKHRDCIIAPMGAGKTFFIEMMLKDDAKNGIKSALLEPFKSIIDNKDDDDDNILKGYKFRFSRLVKDKVKPVMTTVDTFTHLMDTEDFDRIYLDEPQYIIEHFNFRQQAFLPILESMLSDEVDVIGLTGTSRYLDSLGFNPVYFKPFIPLVKRPIDLYISKHTNSTITNTLIKNDGIHNRFISYRINKKSVIIDSVAKSWKLGQPAVGIFSTGKLKDGDRDTVLAKLNKKYIELHGGDEETLLNELRSGVFRGSVSVFHTGIFDSGVDFNVDAEIRNKCTQRIIGDSIAVRENKETKTKAGRKYFTPNLNPTSQYFARFRDKALTSPDDKAKLYPTLEVYCFDGSGKKPKSLEHANKKAKSKRADNKVQYLSNQMGLEKNYTMTEFKEAIESEGNYEVTVKGFLDAPERSSNGTISNAYLFSHLYLTDTYHEMLEEYTAEVVGQYLDLDKAVSGKFNLTESQEVNAEILCRLIKDTISHDIVQDWYWDKTLHTKTLINIVEFLEDVNKIPLLNKALYKGSITQEEWAEFSSDQKRVYSQGLKRFFKVGGDFFKPSKKEQYPTLSIKPLKTLEIRLPEKIQYFYDCWIRREEREEMTINNNNNTNQLKIQL